MKIQFSLLGIIISVISISCHLSFCSWSSGYNQLSYLPKRQQAWGYYFLNNDSKNMLIKKGAQIDSSYLVLKPDGNFILNKIPDLILDSSSCKSVTVNGKWFLSCDKSLGCLIELEGVCVVPFCKKNKHLAIPIGIGDPDECNGAVFEKSDQLNFTLNN